MRKLILGLVLALTASAAYADCTFTTITVDGRTMTCTTCVYGTVVRTNCN